MQQHNRVSWFPNQDSRGTTKWHANPGIADSFWGETCYKPRMRMCRR